MMFLMSLFYALLGFVILVSDEESLGEMGDLGGLMLGGFVLAVGLAVALTFIRIRMRDKRPPEPQFISINSGQQKADSKQQEAVGRRQQANS